MRIYRLFAALLTTLSCVTGFVFLVVLLIKLTVLASDSGARSGVALWFLLTLALAVGARSAWGRSER
jgi:hypothetical protein